MSITAVMIDSREPEWVKNLQFNNAPAAVTFLESGDAWVACDDGITLIIERKSPDDFLNSLRQERLMVQIANLAEYRKTHGFWPYLVITDEIIRGANGKAITNRGETGWSWNAVQGALLTVQEAGVFVQFCAGDADYGPCLTRLASRKRDPKMLVMPAREARLLGNQAAFIAGLPGIGLEKVQTVMQYCGTPAWALVALTDATSQIPGIGNGIKRGVRWTLGLKESEQIGVVLGENHQEELAILNLGEQ
ncbi:MAG: hypothetical protein GYA48_15315 [Chloroflexi bacterium]|nr:hypothetical protein [Chloroflexota bacterium]